MFWKRSKPGKLWNCPQKHPGLGVWWCLGEQSWRWRGSQDSLREPQAEGTVCWGNAGPREADEASRHRPAPALQQLSQCQPPSGPPAVWTLMQSHTYPAPTTCCNSNSSCLPSTIQCVGTIFIFISELRKLKLREVTWLAQDHTASKWQWQAVSTCL
jgi:hypothetical protein